MSRDSMAQNDTVTPQKAAGKDKVTEKSSKKRRRQEQEATADSITESSSPSKKKQRTKDQSDHKDHKSSQQSRTEPDRALLDSHTPFVRQTSSLYLPLSPCCHAFPVQGLCAEHLSPLLLTYYPPLDGILISFTNPRLSEDPSTAPVTISRLANGASEPDTNLADEDDDYGEERAEIVLARSLDEYAPTFVWLTADFTLLRPKRGTWIEGHISLQNESYLGLVCWNFFNAGIERRRLPKDWAWVSAGSASTYGRQSGRKLGGGEAEDEEEDAEEAVEEDQGYFVDGSGQRVEGLVMFRIKDFESAPSTERERGFVSIEGTLLDDTEDREVDEELRLRAKGSRKGREVSSGSKPAADPAFK